MENSKEITEVKKLIEKDPRFTFSAYEPANWYTAKGALKHLFKYEGMGLPDLRGGKMITLTCDQNNFYDAEDAHEKTKGVVRRLIYDLKKVYGNFKYFKKLEFQKNGYPHYHILTDIKQKLDRKHFKRWNEKNIGNIDFKRIKDNSKNALHYLFKYVYKGDECLPAWVLAYKKQFRFVSKSKGFFTKELEIEIKKSNSTAKKKILLKKVKFRSIEEKLNSWQRSALLKIQDENGTRYYKISTSLKCGFHQLKSFMNESSFELLDKLENNLDEWRKSFLYKAWFSSNGKLEFDNIEILAFLLFNSAIDFLPAFLNEEISKLISSFEKYKSLATTAKYTICEAEHLSDTEIYYRPIEEINMLQKAS